MWYTEPEIPRNPDPLTVPGDFHGASGACYQRLLQGFLYASSVRRRLGAWRGTESMRGTACLVLTVTAILVIAPVTSEAQITVTALRGNVHDPSGAVIPGVELRLKDTATGIEKITQSLENGG